MTADQSNDGVPDVRFSFANERTFLAWIRTSLGLVTAGLAITQLLPPFHLAGGRRLIGLPLIALGVVVALFSFRSWRANEEAMRNGRSLPGSLLPRIVAAVVSIVAVCGLALVVFAGSSKSAVSIPTGATLVWLQSARTSWNRSNLSLLGCGLLVVRGAARPPLVAGHVATGRVIVALGAVIWCLGECGIARLVYEGTRARPTRSSCRSRSASRSVGVAAFVVAAFFPDFRADPTLRRDQHATAWRSPTGLTGR